MLRDVVSVCDSSFHFKLTHYPFNIYLLNLVALLILGNMTITDQMHVPLILAHKVCDLLDSERGFESDKIIAVNIVKNIFDARSNSKFRVTLRSAEPTEVTNLCRDKSHTIQLDS